MPLDPINPIGPRPSAQLGRVPGVRRVDSATDRGNRDDAPPQERRRREPEPEAPPPPDDGRPHIDVRV